jgi:hypothetical protein
MNRKRTRYYDQSGMSERSHPYVLYTNVPLTHDVFDWLRERFGIPYSIQRFRDQPSYRGGSAWTYCDCRVTETETFEYGYSFKTEEMAMEFKMRWT